jgi:hypothetical protein
MSDIETKVRSMIGLHERIVADVPALRRGRVWCRECGHTERVDSAECLRHGWPKHCGYTMTIDPPEPQR